MAGMVQSPANVAERRESRFARIDWWLVLAALLLLTVGLMSQFSIDASGIAKRRAPDFIVGILMGFVPFAVMFFVNPRTWQRFAGHLYWANIGLLLLVLKMGSSAGGAQRWLSLGPVGFQPSEMAKLILCLTLASFFAARQEDIEKPQTFLLSLVHIALPAALVFKQPHLGGTLVIIAIWLSMSWISGVPIKYVLIAIAVAMGLFFAAIKIPGILKPYQLERLQGLMSNDEQGKSYQPIRAAIALGVGGLTGTGFLKGEQKAAGYVPEQETDFIITVIGEEGGLVGTTLVLAGFCLLLFRAWLISFAAMDPFSRLAAIGAFAVFGFHTVVNLGMNLQLLPVVGLWLPFLSYGRTALWLCMALVGLLLNLGRRESKVLF